jgi:hypothetical protein
LDVFAFALLQLFVEWNKFKMKKGTYQLNQSSGMVITQNFSVSLKNKTG